MVRAMPAEAGQPSSRINERLTIIRDIIATAALLVLPAFTIRVLTVARWDRDVATALLINSAPSQLVAASFLTGIAVVLYLSPIVGAYYFVLWARRRNWVYSRVVVGLLVLWVTCLPGLLMMPANLLSPFLPYFAIFLSAHAALWRDRGELHPKAVPVGQLILVGFLFFVLFLAQPSMWLPHERAEIRGTPAQVYVLNNQGDDLIIFDPKARAVLRISNKDITDRQYCYQEDFQTFAQLIFGKPKGLPICP